MTETQPALRADLRALLDHILEAAEHDDRRGIQRWFANLYHLNETEQALLRDILRDIRDRGEAPALSSVLALDYEREPVSIEQFLDDDYYFAHYGRSLYPAWREELLYVCDFASPVVEWLLTGSIGAGKSRCYNDLGQTSAGFLTAQELFERLDASHHRAYRDADGDRTIEGPFDAEVHSRSGPRRIVAAVDEGEKPSIRVETRSGAWDENTPHHKHLALSPSFTLVWKRNDELRPGDVLVRLPGRNDLWGTRTEVDGIELTEAFAEVVGLWVAEGWLAGSGERRYARLCNGEDGEELADLLTSQGWRRTHRYKSADYYLAPVDVSRLLQAWFQPKAANKHVPRFIREAPRGIVCAFLRGYLSGDAHVAKSSIELSSASYTLISQTQTLLWGLGVKATVRERVVNGKSYWRLLVSDKWAKLRFRSDVGFLFQRKRDALDRICCEQEHHRDNDRDVIPYAQAAMQKSWERIPALYRSKSHPFYQRMRTIYSGRIRGAVTRKAVRQALAAPYGPDHVDATLRWIVEERVAFDEVVRVDRGRSTRMYDFQVEDDPSYVNNGFVSHNTWASLGAMIYKGPYLLSCLRDPQTYYGMHPDSVLAFGCFNVTLRNAASVDFQQMQRLVDSSPYFRDVFPRKKGKNTAIEWPQKNIIVQEGSSEVHALGSNLFGVHIDEVNFMRRPKNLPKGVDEKERDQAYQLYNHTSRRMKSRFQQFGWCPGLACIVSSRKVQESFLEKHMDDQRGDPSVHVSDYALWETKGRERYRPESFRVAIGNRYTSTKILDVVDRETDEVSQVYDVPEGQQVIEVPIDFYHDFRRDPDGALRDVAGIPSFAEAPLIHRPESVYECIDETRQHPFACYEAVLPLDDDNAGLIQDMRWRDIVRVVESAHRMLRRPAEPRVIHVDIGLTGDAAGLAMGHRYDYYTITRQDPYTGQTVEEFRPKIDIDFMLRIVPTFGTEIDLTKIVAFILNLRNFGIPLVKVTFDGYQSAMGIQILQKAKQFPMEKRHSMRKDPLADIGGFQGAGRLSVDRDDKAYTLLRDCMSYGAIRYYRYEPFLSEVVALKHDLEKLKVDHPPGGSKDVSDAVAGVCYSLSTLDLPLATRPESIPPPEAGADDLPRKMMDDVVGDAVRAEGIQAIVPAPVSDPVRPVKPSRKVYLGSGRADLIAQIARHGRGGRD